MALDVLDKDEIKDYIDEQIEEIYNQKRKIKISRTMILIIILIILLLLFTCIRVASIGFNSVEAWEVDNIELTAENLQITNNTKLNIFSELNGDNKIAPMSKGTYRFSVKNNSNYDMIYDIKFEDDMTNYINMKYRIKIDNIYIKGNDNKYVSLDELNLENIIVPKHSINVYTLEWCWENDDENDTKIGTMKEDQYYYFKMEIFSNIYDKQRSEQN